MTGEGDESTELSSTSSAPSTRANSAASGLVTGSSSGTKVLGALAIFSNILAGPGILAFPAMVQQSGWAISLVTVLWFAYLTQRCCILLAKAIAVVAIREWKAGAPLDKRFELSTVVDRVFGRSAFLFFQVFLNVSMLLLDLASIVVVAHSLDDAFVKLFGDSPGLQLVGEGGVRLMRACATAECRDVHKWQGAEFGISSGYLVTMALCVPLTLTSFADMMWFQYFAMAVTATCLVTFNLESLFPAEHAPARPALPPAFGSAASFAVSTCFFSFAIGFAVPSWWNDNHPAVDVPRALNLSLVYSTCIYYLPIAFIPAICFAGQFSDPSQQNALVFFYDQHKVSHASQLAAYTLAVVGIMPNVVAYSVAMRDNVRALSDKFTFNVSFALTCLGPWSFAWLFYFGGSLNTLVNWVAIGSNGVVNFLVPLALVIRLAEQQGQMGDQLRQEEDEGLLGDRPLASSVEVPLFTPGELAEARRLLVASSVVVVGGYVLAVAAQLQTPDDSPA